VCVCVWKGGEEGVDSDISNGHLTESENSTS